MKKFIAIIAAIAMIATMSVCAFAAADLTDTNAATGVTEDVIANYVDDEATKVDEIHLEVEWDDTEFTYTATGKIWNEEKLAWEDNAGSWTDDEAAVSVETKSSKGVTVTVAYTAAEEDGVAATFDETSATLVAADADEGETTATFTLTVDEGEAIDADTTAGTIKVTVA